MVLIVVDTLRADGPDLEPGNPLTPHLAQLASEGVAFPLAFSHAPMTLPAHAALFSGRLPHEIGVLNNGQSVPTEVPLLAERFSSEGYQTRAVLSLATLWPEVRQAGLDRGFSSYDQGDLEVSPASETTPRLNRALDGLSTNAPFFLFAHLSDPHEPYNDGGASGRFAELSVDGERVEMLSTSQMSYRDVELSLGPGEHELVLSSEHAFKVRKLELSGDDVALEWRDGALLTNGKLARVRLTRRSPVAGSVRLSLWLNDTPSLEEIRARYEQEVARADAAIGALVSELKRRGLYEDTLIVVTSDHGEALGEHGRVGHVETLYDELLQVPLVIRLPRGRLDPRLVRSHAGLVRHVDVAPTILEEAGLDPLPDPSGSSLFSERERALLAETHRPEATRDLMCVRDEQYKLVYDPLLDDFEMYRLGPDPLELDDVFAHQGHLRETWQLVLRRLSAESGSPSVRSQETQAKLSALGY